MKDALKADICRQVSTLKGLDSHYGTKGLRKVLSLKCHSRRNLMRMVQVTVDCHNGGKVTFQFSYAAGNNNGTSVEDGQIPEIIFYTWAPLWSLGSYNWQEATLIWSALARVWYRYIWRCQFFYPCFPVMSILYHYACQPVLCDVNLRVRYRSFSWKL